MFKDRSNVSSTGKAEPPPYAPGSGPLSELLARPLRNIWLHVPSASSAPNQEREQNVQPTHKSIRRGNPPSDAHASGSVPVKFWLDSNRVSRSLQALPKGAFCTLRHATSEPSYNHVTCYLPASGPVCQRQGRHKIGCPRPGSNSDRCRRQNISRAAIRQQIARADTQKNTQLEADSLAGSRTALSRCLCHCK